MRKSHRYSWFQWAAGAVVASVSATGQSPAAPEPPAPVELRPITIRPEQSAEPNLQEPFFPAVQGAQIFSGKKATAVDLDALPAVQASNYRQALTKTPGLLLSEESTPLVSLGYRGLGDPHRTQFIQVLQDGIPLHADPVGYPEAYFTPPLDGVDFLEFVRGGASIMYGPQPAGSLNYRTRQPRRDREFALDTRHTFGSYDLYSTYSQADGTIGRVGYLASFNHRQSAGFRAANSDQSLYYGHLKLVLDADRDRSWTFALDTYEEEHGEPGGLTLATGPGLATYDLDREQSIRLYDRFELRRYVPSVTLIQDLGDASRVEVRAWGGYYDRFSRRQRGVGFGAYPTGAAANSNDLERQEFYTLGTEARVRHDYQIGAETQTLAAGVHFYHSDSPRTDRRGATPDAVDGLLQATSQREVYYGSVFAENRFKLGALSVTPAFRLENIHQDISVTRPPVASPLVSAKAKTEVEPLFALTTAYELPRHTEVFASVAQSYRPTVFTESVIPSSGSVIQGDVNPTTAWTYELGYRGLPTDWFNWDTSLFLTDLDNRFGGTVTTGGQTELRSVGRSLNYGWDAAAELDVLGLRAALQDQPRETRTHRLSLYGNLSLLAAEIQGGTFDGRRPQYAPDYIVRSGVIYRWDGRAKIGLMGNFVGQHFATDDENPTRQIPSYVTWDLTAEFHVYRDRVSVVAGINNLLDENYYARIRGDGIDPAAGRTFYAGFQFRY